MLRRTFLMSMVASAATPAVADGALSSMRTCFGFSFTALNGGLLNLSDYAGKPIMVVNTASLCGFTPQYAGLQKLWTMLGPRGLVIIGVPSNDFGGQEPGGRSSIQETAESYHVSFPMADKVKVVGTDAHPFYRWAALEKPREIPRWNFHKYLVGADGHIAASIPTGIEPTDPQVIAAVEREFRSAPPAG